jgi:hypothetical protein
MSGYDFKRLVYSAILFTGFMYLMILSVVQVGHNYDKNTTDLGGGDLFDEDNWIIGTTNTYEDVAGIRNASATASVTNLDEPTSSKTIFDDIVNLVLLPFNLFFTLIAVIFNMPSPIMYILATILIIEIILVVWRLLKVGD